MKTKSKICILLGTLPSLLLLGVFAQPEPEAGAKPEAEVAASPAPESGVKAETEVAAPPAPATVVKSEAEPAAQPTTESPAAPAAAVPAVKAEPETVVRLDPVTVSAKTPEQLYLDAVVADPAVPYPVAVSFPKFRDLDYGTNYGRTLEVEFVVGADGIPRNFRMVRPTLEPRLSSQIITAMKSWRFSPAHRGDDPVAMRVSVEARIGQPAVVAMK